MIIILKQGAQKDKVHSLVHSLEESGLHINYSEGSHTTILGLIGDTSAVDTDQLAAMDIVEGVKRVSEPYKAANRKFHTDDTVVRIGQGAFGGGHFGVIAGPCSILFTICSKISLLLS